MRYDHTVAKAALTGSKLETFFVFLFFNSTVPLKNMITLISKWSIH